LVSVEKLSISLDSELAGTVRNAASAQGVSVSTWLADAAQAQVRQIRLRDALDALAAEVGGLDPDEVDRLVAAARNSSTVVTGDRGAA
jgi:hypothetical protein